MSILRLSIKVLMKDFGVSGKTVPCKFQIGMKFLITIHILELYHHLSNIKKINHHQSNSSNLYSVCVKTVTRGA
jgi:hypothetical protein